MGQETPPSPTKLGERLNIWYVRARSRRLVGPFLRLGIISLGVTVTLLGLVLVPLPGPGWAIVFLGLALTSVEFKPARRVLVMTRGAVRGWTEWIRRQPLWVRLAATMTMLTVVVAVSSFAVTHARLLLN